MTGAGGGRAGGDVPPAADEQAAASGEREHAYGPRVRLLANPLLDTLMARLCAPGTPLREITSGVRRVYETLIAEATRHFPRCRRDVPTRMADAHPEAGVLHGEQEREQEDPAADGRVEDGAPYAPSRGVGSLVGLFGEMCRRVVAGDRVLGEDHRKREDVEQES